MLTQGLTYQALFDGFAWDLPDRLNMATQACDNWAEAEPDRVAIIDLTAERRDVTYRQLRAMADGLAQCWWHAG